LALVTVSCLGSDFADSVEGAWQMTSGTLDGEEIPLLDSHPITITFEGDQVSETASCNGYGGAYELSGASITWGNPTMTEMACFPEETMRAEAMFADAIIRIETVTVDEGLTLTGYGVELVFEGLDPVPDSELTGTMWVLNGLIQGDAVSPPVSTTGAYVVFDDDGSLEGDTGCRPFSGHYTISGAEVVVTDLAADGHECEPGLAEQDSHFISAIEGGFRVEIVEDTLTTRARGDEGLSFVAG
jgi:heat shock protein HslJ